MKNWLSILLMCLLVSCANTPRQPDAASGSDNAKVAEDLAVENSSTQPERKTAIDPQVLYLLMAAELAGQRNELGIALDGYLEAARQVDDPRVAERAAHIGLFVRDAARTEEAVDLWLNQDSDNITARKIAALAAISNGDQAKAVEHLKKLLSLDPAGFEENVLEIAKLLNSREKIPFLQEVLATLEADATEQAALFFVEAVLASQMQENELAWQKNSRALAIQPDWAKALVLQAQLAGKMDRLEDAEALLSRALEQSPEDMRIRKMLAQVLAEQDDYDAAIDLYLEVLEDKEADGESLFAIGLLYLQQGDLDRSEDYLSRLLDDADWSSQASYYLGRIAIDRKDYDAAQQWMDQVNEGGFVFEARVAAVSLAIEQKQFDLAEQRLSEAEENFPLQRTRLLLLRSDLYSQSGQFQQAYDLLSDALENDADNRDLLYARALVAERLNRLDILEADLLKILQENPKDTGALNALGYTLVDRLNRLDDAKVYLEQAISLEPEEAVIIDSYGWLQFKLGNNQKALQYIEQAYDKLPENEIAAHLAEILWAMGRQDKAQKLIEAALEKEPDDRFLLDFKKRFLVGGE